MYRYSRDPSRLNVRYPQLCETQVILDWRLLAKFSCDLCDWLASKISSILSKSKFTSRSCSGDFLLSSLFSDLFAFSASQNIVLRSFSQNLRRSRVPINNFMSHFIQVCWRLVDLPIPKQLVYYVAYRISNHHRQLDLASLKAQTGVFSLVFQVSFGLFEDPSHLFPPSFEPWADLHHETLQHFEVLTCQNSRGEPSTVRPQASLSMWDLHLPLGLEILKLHWFKFEHI